MKTLLTILLSIIVFKSYGQTNLDTSLITIFPYDTAQHWVAKNGKTTTLTTEDFLKIDNLLTNCVNDYNGKQVKQFEKNNKENPEYNLNKKNFLIDLTEYKRQYVATINSKGEKEVWVNCFCDAMSFNWKQHLVFVFDGGKCYFNLKINLTTGQYYDFIINGDA